jgi:CRISPR-associated protein Cas1
MAVLYLVEQGATLRKDGENLVVEKERETLARVPLLRLEQVVVYGNVQLTTPVVGTLLRRGIDAVFLSTAGRYYGRLVAPESRFGELRMRQLEAARDGAARVALARCFAAGKLTNERTMLMRYARGRSVPPLDAAVRGIADCLARLGRVESLGGVLAAEGHGTALYFRGLRAVLARDLGFTTRARRPPPDPVNALLSFGYTLLLHSVQSAVQTVGLDPYIGLLHAVVYSRPALPLDLMEEFRPVIVDSIVLRLVNTRRLREEHFIGVEERPGVYLAEEGKRRFLEQYEERLNTRIAYGPTGEQVTYRRCLELQARHLARVLQGREDVYRPYLVK